MSRRGNTAADFWAIVHRGEGCWTISGSHDRDGYGRFPFANQAIRAHRLAWILTNGPIPDGIYVCHHCDNPGCVRPDHLFLATNTENLADKKAKNRQAKGEQIWNGNKLKTADVVKIRDLWHGGCMRSEIARLFGVSWTAINAVVKGMVWKHVD